MDRIALPDVIETERLVLRGFRLADVDDVFAYAQDAEWSRYLRMLPRPYERKHAEEFVARQLLLDRITHPAWAITLAGTVVGSVNLTFHLEHCSAEMGYSVAREHWNKGVCTEAARAVIGAAFETHRDLNRLFARADVDNVASQRVMEKAGMTKEGVLRLNRMEGGEAIDDAVFSILKKEWNAQTG